jgi:diacylglycerol O-acyltransferase
MADGISGAALLKVMLDPTPEGSHAIRKARFRPPKQDAPGETLGGAIAGALQGTLENMLAVETGILDLAQALVGGGLQVLSGLVRVLPELAASVERLPFNKPCLAERRFCWAEADFSEVQAIRAAAGCGTINDVILTVVTRAVAKYARLHGESIANRYLRVVCPVNLRHGDNGESLGNRISFLPVALPMDVEDPVEMLRMVTARTELMKNLRVADLVALAGSWIGLAPPPVQAAFWQTLPYITFPLPLLNMICTNVPGSPVPLYAAGRRLIASYPHVPTGYELGVGCAVQSYAGKLFFGLTSDAQAAPDAGKLRDFILAAFGELRRAAGVAAGVKAAPRARRAAPRARRRKPARAAAAPVAPATAERATAAAQEPPPAHTPPEAAANPLAKAASV